MSEKEDGIIRNKLKRFFGTKRRMTLIAVAVIVLAIAIPTSIKSIEITEDPSFCGKNCHIMRAHYNYWRTSTHNDIRCVECHYEPGVIGHIKGKINGMMQLISYETTSSEWGGFLHAEVKNKNCLKCHKQRISTGTVNFNEIKFSHVNHTLHERRNRTLQCTSCHSMVVMGMEEHESVTDPSCTNCHQKLSSNETGHLVVTKTSCFLCHFRDVPKNSHLTQCPLCHSAPIEAIEYDGIEFRHEKHIKYGLGCKNCHVNITIGADAEVNKTKCNLCHTTPRGIERIKDMDKFLHQTMVTKHQVSCYMCHERIEHKPQVKNDLCLDCHANEHPKGWIYKHREEVLIGKVCDNCHNAKFCSNCHSNIQAVNWSY